MGGPALVETPIYTSIVMGCFDRSSSVNSVAARVRKDVYSIRRFA